MVSCKYCQRNFSNKGGLGSHEPYCKINPNRGKRYRSPLSGAKKGSKSWNKGLKFSDYFDPERLDIISKKISEKGKLRFLNMSDDSKEKFSEKISKKLKGNSGGIRKGGGRGKKGWYRGYWCDSTWELAWVIYNLEHGIHFERNTEGFNYVYKNQVFRYFPDFIKDGVYIEIKGRNDYEGLGERDKCKIDQFENNIEVLYKSEMNPILRYVKDKYGKNIENLYDKERC